MHDHTDDPQLRAGRQARVDQRTAQLAAEQKARKAQLDNTRNPENHNDMKQLTPEHPDCNFHLLGTLYLLLAHPNVSYLTIHDDNGTMIDCNDATKAHDEARATSLARITIHASDQATIGEMIVAGYEHGPDTYLDYWAQHTETTFSLYFNGILDSLVNN